MNKSFYIILLSVVLIFGCKDLIDLKPESQFTSGNFYQNADDMELALNGTYDALQSVGQYGQYFVYLMEVSGDNSTQESITNSGGVFAAFDIFNVQPSNDVLNTVWNSCYDGINRANTVIQRLGQVEIDQDRSKDIAAQARFIRALTYFNLVRIWGAVPLVLSENEDPISSFQVGRTSESEVYEAIITDLTTAIDELDEGSYPGRASKGAARVLLAKVYMVQDRFSDASSLLAEVVGSGFTLQTTFDEVFQIENESNAEVIFEVEFTESGSVDAGNIEGSRFANLFVPIGATSLVGGVGTTSGDNLPTQELYDTYDPTDLRRNTIETLDDGRIYSTKFTDVPLAPFNAENNFIVLRYADVLLMQAECLNELSYAADGVAFDLINQVRNRAGLPDLASTGVPNQAAFREAVWLERRLELAFENHRWFDLKRTNQIIAVLDGHEAANGPVSVSSNQLLFPIPQLQIDIMNNEELMYQNPGYQ